MSMIYVLLFSLITFSLSLFLHKNWAQNEYPYLSSLAKSSSGFGKIVSSSLLAIFTLILLLKIFHQPDFFKSISQDLENVISILFALVSFIAVLLLLPQILEKMQGKVFRSFFIQWDVISLGALIILVEFSILNWLKETDVYVLEKYLNFVLWYSLALIVIGTLLGTIYLVRVHKIQKVLTNPKFILVTLLSQIVIVSYANMLMWIMWHIIIHFPT